MLRRIAELGVALTGVLVLMTNAMATPANNSDTQLTNDCRVTSRRTSIPCKKVTQTEVCFTVHNLGDPTDQQVSGTLFETKDYTPDSTALLVQHGAVAERSAWDGARPRIQGVPSRARQLAQAGYGVFAIDRLGYARSPYESPMASGHTLTYDSYVEMTREMVDQIRSGTYRVTTGSCAIGAPAQRPASKVVLMGLGPGGAISELYATRNHDSSDYIDGVISLSWSNQGYSNRALANFTNTVLPQILAGEEYAYWFASGPDGYSIDCEELLFSVGGVTEQQLEQLCGPEYYGDTEARTSPVGESVGDPQNEMQASIGQVGPTIAALLVFADKDAFFTDADSGGGEPDLITPEMDMWSNGRPGDLDPRSCNCEVSFQFQDSGHAGWFHNSAPAMTANVIEWLRSRGL